MFADGAFSLAILLISYFAHKNEVYTNLSIYHFKTCNDVTRSSIIKIIIVSIGQTAQVVKIDIVFWSVLRPSECQNRDFHYGWFKRPEEN